MKDEKERKTNIFAMIFKSIIALLSILFIILPIAMPFVFKKLQIEPITNPHIVILGVSVTIAILFIALPFFWIFMAVKYDKLHLINNLRELSAQLKGNLENCEKLTTHIENCPRNIDHNMIEKSYLMSKSEFFNYLKKAREQTQTREHTEIRLMNFTKSITKQKNEIESAEQYYKNEIDFYYDNRDKVTVYRIISIHTKEKFCDFMRLAKEALDKELPNYNLAYLDIDNFNEKLPKITGVQLIGEDELILMDPTQARISSTNFLEPIFIKNKEIAEKYRDYYVKLWDEITAYHRLWLKEGQNKNISNEGYIGHILYSGEDFSIAKDNVWREINQKMSDDQRLSDDKLKKMGITNLSENSAHEKQMKNNNFLSFFNGLFGKNKEG